MLLYVLENGFFNKSVFINELSISELDYFRYKNEVLNMLHDFYRFDILERLNKKTN